MKADLGEICEAVLDGMASTDERAALENLLSADPQARARFEAMGDLHRMLERVPQVDPPADLAVTILARLDCPERPGVRRFDAPMRYAAAFIAGLLVAASLYEISGGEQPEVDLMALTGTMVDRGSIEALATPATHTDLEVAGVSGRLAVQRSRGLVVLSVELAADGGSDLVLPLSGTVRILGFAGLDGHQPGVTLTEGAFRLQRPAPHRYAIVLQGAGPALAVEFRRDGTLVHAADLPIPGRE